MHAPFPSALSAALASAALVLPAHADITPESRDSSIDIADPVGALNFFEISAYVTLYNAGCP